MTEGAQHALRCIMEQYSHTTRFAIACNDSSKIIDAIQSRCALIRFSKLSNEAIQKRLEKVIELEGVMCDAAAMQEIIIMAEGDMRNALNNMEATWNSVREDIIPIVTLDVVNRVCDQPNPQTIRNIVSDCVNGKLSDAIGIILPDEDDLLLNNLPAYTTTENDIQLIPGTTEKGLMDLVRIGYSSDEILSSFSRVILRETKNPNDMHAVIMSDDLRAHFLMRLSKYRIRASEGVGTVLQLTSLLSEWCNITSIQAKQRKKIGK